MGTAHARGWQPHNTWVVVVGTLEWKHADSLAPFPKEKRRDEALVNFFLDEGVPEEQVLYLQDAQATAAAIAEQIPEHLAAADADALLFLYYCGHGYLDDDGAAFLACYDALDDGVPGWAMTAIPETIEEHFGGSTALLAVDCCYSGCLTDAVASRAGSVAYACLSSSSASELSTGNWTFTECLLAGLQGRAFADGDDSATITLAELATQIQDDMAFAEEQLASFAISNGFDATLVLASAKPRTDPVVGRRVEALSGGEWYKARVVDAAGDSLRVHYYGYEASDDEWLTHAEIRGVSPPRYEPGTAVEALWKGEWYAATVLESRGGVQYIAYDGFDAQWNEWAASSRIRLPA